MNTGADFKLSGKERELLNKVCDAFHDGGRVTAKVTVKNVGEMAGKEASAWKTEAGDYRFLFGASSRDIRCSAEAPVAAAEVKVHPVPAIR